MTGPSGEIAIEVACAIDLSSEKGSKSCCSPNVVCFVDLSGLLGLVAAAASKFEAGRSHWQFVIWQCAVQPGNSPALKSGSRLQGLRDHIFPLRVGSQAPDIFIYWYLLNELQLFFSSSTHFSHHLSLPGSGEFVERDEL